MKIMFTTLAALLAASTAQARHEKPPPGDDPADVAARPKWCGTQKRVLSEGMHPDFLLSHTGDRVDAMVLIRVGLSHCATPRNDKLKALFTKVRADYAQYHGTSEAEIDEILALAALATTYPEGDFDKGCAAQTYDGKAGHLTAELAMVPYLAIGCPKTIPFFNQKVKANLAWYLDFPDATPSQLLLTEHIAQTIAPKETILDLDGYPLAALDATRLDRKLLGPELDKLATPTVRALALAKFYYATHLPALAKHKLEETAATEPQAKGLLEIPDRARAEWDKLYGEHKEDLDLAYAMEKKVLELPIDELGKLNTMGCEDLRKRYRSYGTSKKPKTVADAEAVLRDPVGFVLLEATALCDAAELHSLAAKIAYQVMFHDSVREFHGPRLYALSLAYGQAMELAKAAEKTKRPPPLQPGLFTFRGLPASQTINGIGDEETRFMTKIYEDPAVAKQDAKHRSTVRGRVKSITKTADGATIKFAAEKWQEADEECTRGAIINWNVDVPIYDWHCKVVGYHTESVTNDDINVTADALAIVKPGQMIQFVYGKHVSGKPVNGAVFMIGDQKGKDLKWTSVLGVATAK